MYAYVRMQVRTHTHTHMHIHPPAHSTAAKGEATGAAQSIQQVSEKVSNEENAVSSRAPTAVPSLLGTRLHVAKTNTAAQTHKRTSYTLLRETQGDFHGNVICIISTCTVQVTRRKGKGAINGKLRCGWGMCLDLQPHSEVAHTHTGRQRDSSCRYS